MDWCGSSTPRTPEDRIMNEERHERKAYWLVIVRPQFLTGGDTKGLCPSIPWSCRNKVQVYRGREPVAVSAVLPELWGSRNRRALILGWAYYLDAFSSYPLRTWLPSVYRGHDNWSWHKVRILALPEWYLTDGSGPPEGGLLRLPPKLRRKGPKPIPGNSEAS
nr:hypothetical protein GOBAR_AA29305 [Ipomoea trifida]